MYEKALAMLMHIFRNTEIDADTLRFIYDHMRMQQFPDGTVLCREGSDEATFYVLVDGQVDIYRSQDGETHLVDTLNPGTCFGELALLLGVPRTADVISSGPVTVLEMVRADFNEYIRSSPQLLLVIAQLVIQRMLNQEQRRLLQLSLWKKQQVDAPTIFMSYARADEAFARQLAFDLKKHQINTWLDVHEITAGKSWARQIGESLDRCTLMLLILSPAAMTSQNVDDEWNYYLDKGKAIIPILYLSCEIPYRLHKLQYVDFINTSRQSALTRLIANLRVHIEQQ